MGYRRLKKPLSKVLSILFIMTAVLSSTAVIRAEAADTVKYKIIFQLNQDKTVTYEEGQGAAGDTLKVRSTYYDKDTGKDYDLDDADSQTLVSGKSEYIFRYKSYEAPSIEGSVTLINTDGEILETSKFTIAPQGETTYSNIPATFTAKDGKVYVKEENQPDAITVNYNSEEIDYTVLYEKVSDIKPYSVTVKYADTDGTVLQTRNFTVTGAAYIYYAPLTFKLESGDVQTYYNIVDSNQAVIRHDPDSKVREYTIQYSAFDGKTPYKWYVYKYDGYTNKPLGNPTEIEVPIGQTVSYKPEAAVTSGGTAYNLDPGMADTYTHTYGDSERISYVYYNPEGYVPEKNYIVQVQYRNIADNNVIDSTTVTAMPGDNTYITCPKEYEANGIKYVRLDGQKDEITHSYYSPKRTYTIYYRDINDTQYENTVITREETITTTETVYDTEVIPGGTTATPGTAAAPAGGTAPGGTTVGATDQETGETQVQGTENPDGTLVTQEDEEVPLGNIDASQKDDGKEGFMSGKGRYILFAAIALLIVLGIIAAVKVKQGKEKKDEV